MSLKKPYYRIWRPFIPSRTGVGALELIRDSGYAHDSSDLIRSYRLLERELSEIFEFIEPCDPHLACYSHRLYSLLLRASTEFETNAKGVLAANGYKQNGNWNINDYKKLEVATRLSEYQVTVHVWKGPSRVIYPFREWASQSSLPWYQGYNSVKHHRAEKFQAASLENAVTAVAAVFALLFSQFNVCTFFPSHCMTMYSESDGLITHDSSMLGVRLPKTWAVQDQYDFDWDVLRKSNAPFATFPF